MSPDDTPELPAGWRSTTSSGSSAVPDSDQPAPPGARGWDQGTARQPGGWDHGTARQPGGWHTGGTAAPGAWGSDAGPGRDSAVPPAGAPPGWTPAPAGARRLPVRPSPVFFALLGAFAGAGFLCANNVGNARIWVFAFVALGWVISLCLHEFAHAAVAWWGGDRSVEARGYLTLDPRRYINSQTSIILPIIIVLIGGIALPGGAVMIDRRLVRSRHMRSLIAAAGPLTNLACALLCGLPLATGLVKYNVGEILFQGGVRYPFAAALAFLTLLEIIVTILNALPVPGFDGFAILAPYLPEETVRQLLPISRFAWFGMFIVLFYSATANTAFFGFCDHVLTAIGVNHLMGEYGQALFTFWKKL